MIEDNTLYITGAGVSAESGIPTFRGTDGLWTVGSQNYTPQEMATRQMYLSRPDEFLLWYFKRFASYRDIKPNTVHHWLADKRLVTQNIDGLDGKAGNAAYVPIHGRLDRATLQSLGAGGSPNTWVLFMQLQIGLHVFKLALINLFWLH